MNDTGSMPVRVVPLDQVANDGPDMLDAILDHLSPRERQVIVLAHGLEDGRARTVDETAIELGLTVNNVRHHLKTAKRKARSWWNGEPMPARKKQAQKPPAGSQFPPSDRQRLVKWKGRTKPLLSARAFRFLQEHHAGASVAVAADRAGISYGAGLKLAGMFPSPHGTTRGNNTAFSEEVKARYKRLRSEGASRGLAATTVGVSPSTGANWDRG